MLRDEFARMIVLDPSPLMPRSVAGQELLALWRAHAPAGGVPRPDQVRPERFRHALGHVSVLAPRPGRDGFDLRLFGTETTVRFDLPKRLRTTADLPSGLGAALEAIAEAAAEARHPAYFHTILTEVSGPRRYEFLALPLTTGSAGATVPIDRIYVLAMPLAS